jgi:hypothetical protein
MDSSWKQADVIPIIVRLIEQAYQEKPGFVTTDEIATRLLRDAEGRHLVELAWDQHKKKQSIDWHARNMISWFSQRITVGESQWSKAFERTKIDGRWAYKPINTTSHADKS